MERKAVSGIIFILLLTSMLALAFNIQPVKAQEIVIVIRPDGTVDPPSAPIKRDGNSYTFTSNISSSVWVEKDYAIIDGNFFTIKYLGYSGALWIKETKHVVIENINIIGNDILVDHCIDTSIFGNNILEGGIIVWYGSKNYLAGNDITDSTDVGIRISSSINNTLYANLIENSTRGIELMGSSGNFLSQNFMVDNQYNFGIGYSTRLSDFINIVDESNTINGKPIYYWIGKHDMVVPKNAGYVGLINSERINVEGLELANNIQGLLLGFTNNSRIIGNKITNNENGINLVSSGKNNIQGNNIKDNYDGIGLNYQSSDNRVSENNIKDNEWYGVGLDRSSNNSISGNNIANNRLGIILAETLNNIIYHNNFLNNTDQVYIDNSVNVWDDGYPSGGNYWSDYAGVDANGDGVGDTPYVIDADNQDRYPLMRPWTLMPTVYTFSIVWEEETFIVSVESNSTLSNFAFNQPNKEISFYVTGEAGTMGFCNVTIPKQLLDGEPWTVLIDDITVPFIQIENETHNILYFTYAHSTHIVQIIGTHVIEPSPPQTYSLTITTTVGGTTDPASGTYSYTANSTVQVTAIPNANYLFDHWELDTVNVGSANPYTAPMDKDHTVKAVFSPIPPPLSASINPLSASINVGQSVTFASSVSGGYTPYTFQWYLNGAPVSGATSNTCIFTPTTSGIYYIYLKVTDTKDNKTQSETARITVATVPVGGYSIQIKGQNTPNPLTLYIALIAMLATVFTAIRRKIPNKK